MTLENYLLYLAAVGVFFATPPDTSQLLIISNSVRFGLKRSLLTIAGDLTANCIQMTCAAFGLATIIAASASAFLWIKWLGVGYLAYLGLQLIFTKENKKTISISARQSRFRLYGQGFFTSMANPFAVIFFAALFPQFINPTLPILPQLLILGSTYLAVDGLILVIWGWLGIRAADGLKRISFRLVNKVCGSLMLAAAILLATKDLEPQK